MFEYLLKVRYLAVAIVILAVLHAVAFLVMATQTAFKAYGHVLDGEATGGTARPGLELLHSLDFLFVTMVLMVLALGIAKLFLGDPTGEKTAMLPTWLRIDSIGELKLLLWETILTTLLIVGLSELTAAGLFSKPDWTVLMTPFSILILALSLYLMRKS